MQLLNIANQQRGSCQIMCVLYNRESGEKVKRRYRRKKPHTGLIVALGITLLIADALLMAYLFVPGVKERSGAVLVTKPTATQLLIMEEQRANYCRAVFAPVKERLRESAGLAVTYVSGMSRGYVAHSRFNVSNFDFDRYRTDHPQMTSPDDEDFLLYVHLVRQGIAQNTPVHSTDPVIEEQLQGEGREALLSEMRDAFYADNLIEGWDTAQYTPEEEAAILDFYSGAVFAGDSVMLGFSYHCADNEDPFFAGMKFLSAGSYSLREAFKEDGEFHPLFRGQVMPLWESLPQSGARKVFLFFGINDVAVTTDLTDQYLTLIERIREAAPGIEIIILSATYPYEQGNRLNGDNLTALNEIMRWKAAELGLDYVDVASPLSDGQGRLLQQYCSDGQLHMTWSAYDVWGEVLKAYAYTRIYHEPPPAGQQDAQEEEAAGQP